jgi:hypothetical protein
MTGPTPHPRAVSTTDAAGPKVVGCSGETLRRWFKEDKTKVHYVYQIGSRYYVSTPKMHRELHGVDIPWTDCQGCWALGADDSCED